MPKIHGNSFFQLVLAFVMAKDKRRDRVPLPGPRRIGQCRSLRSQRLVKFQTPSADCVPELMEPNSARPHYGVVTQSWGMRSGGRATRGKEEMAFLQCVARQDMNLNAEFFGW